jgi:hypothetical protein
MRNISLELIVTLCKIPLIIVNRVFKVSNIPLGGGLM